MSTPQENQQTVEALAIRTFQLADELQAALDDPKRYEWGDGPWEHLGDAERDVRLLLYGIDALRDVLTQIRDTAKWYGEPATLVAKQMGHADPGITMKTYAHLFEEQESVDAARERLQSMVGGLA